MKTVFFVGLWLVGMIVWVYLFFGSGKDARQREALHGLVAQAQAAMAAGDYEQAESAYSAAAAKMPPAYATDGLELKLHAAKAQAVNGEIVAAITAMDDLLVTMPSSLRSQQIGRDIRDTLARNHYYAAWIMRLEGAPREKWIVHADRARQNYRVMAERAVSDRTPQADYFSRNLEAVVNLTRMDLPTLKSLPLPPEAQQGRQRGVGEGQPQPGQPGKGKKPGKGDKKGPPSDARGSEAGPGRRPEAFGS